MASSSLIVAGSIIAVDPVAAYYEIRRRNTYGKKVVFGNVRIKSAPLKLHCDEVPLQLRISES
jgi:NAD-dependent SIR2 family protein deacetylase